MGPEGDVRREHARWQGANAPGAWWKRGPFVLLAAVAAIVLAIQSSPGRSFLGAIGMAQPPPALSPLYFTSPRTLPATEVVGTVHVPVDFAVRNDTQRSQDYHWTVELVDGASTTRSAAGDLTVRRGGTGRVQRVITGYCWSGSLKVVVRLADPTEAIDYLATCNVPT